MAWNHNIHYHQFILNAIPEGCARALDVGCGYGSLTEKLSHFAERVTGIDIDKKVLDIAGATYSRSNKIDFAGGDFMAYDFGDIKFDFITALATLHHLPIEAAIIRFAGLLTPNGRIAIVGLYKPRSLIDYIYAITAFPISRLFRLLRSEEAQQAAMADPLQSFIEIKKKVEDLLPGARIKRRLFFRYTITWVKE